MTWGVPCSSCDRKFISCQRKYISCHRKFSSCPRKFISCHRKFISCHRKFISCHRNKKECLVSQDIFPVYERKFIVTGCPKKNVPKIVWIICPAANMLDGWDFSHLRDGICSSVWSTKTYMCDIREPRYKEIKIVYHN